MVFTLRLRLLLQAYKPQAWLQPLCHYLCSKHLHGLIFYITGGSCPFSGQNFSICDTSLPSECCQGPFGFCHLMPAKICLTCFPALIPSISWQYFFQHRLLFFSFLSLFAQPADPHLDTLSSGKLSPIIFLENNLPRQLICIILVAWVTFWFVWKIFVCVSYFIYWLVNILRMRTVTYPRGEVNNHWAVIGKWIKE